MKFVNAFNKYCYLILSVFVIFFIITYCLHVIYPTVYFCPVDGNYQNFNVVRRLFDGQVPYKDFAVYLGSLHLYLGAFFTWIFGNNFVASVYSFEVLTLITFCMISFALGYALKYKTYSICILTIFLILLALVVNCVSGSSVTAEIITQGNSARLLRAFCLPCGVMLLLFVNEKVINIYLKYCLIGLIIGTVSTFSNDYGTTTLIAYSIILVYKLFITDAKIIEKFFGLLLYTFFVLFGVLIAIVLFSQGNLMSFFENNFGIASYQGWYYHAYYDPIICNLYKINFSFWGTAQLIFCFCMFYLMYKNRNNANLIKYEMLALLNLSCWGAVQASHFLAGGGRDVPFLIFLLSLLWLFVDFLKSKFDIKKIKIISLVVIFFALIFIVVNPLVKFTEYKKNNTLYIPKIGGKISNYTDDALDAQKFIGSKKIFSSHSSVLEDLTDQFQPSGYDYIIHVLGDDARKKYLNSFRSAQFDYVTEQKDDNTNYAQSFFYIANYDFYREVFRYYEPVYTNKYLTILQKSNVWDFHKLPEGTKVEFLEMSDDRVKVNVYTDNTITGIADIDFNFDIKSKNKFKSKFLLYRKILSVKEDSAIEMENYPSSAYENSQTFRLPAPNCKVIPIYIINGFGSLTLQAEPKRNVQLVINKFKPTYYTKSPLNYIEIIEVEDDCIKIARTNKNLMLLKFVKSIKYGGKIYDIKKIMLDDFNIYLKFQNKIQSDSKVYFIELAHRPKGYENEFIYVLGDDKH